MIPDQKGGTTNDDNVIIVGSLNTEALTASVDQLVKHVKDKTEEMTGSFRKSVSEINTVVKTLKDANVGDGGDGGGSKRTTSNKREQSSVESLTLSYYKLLGALQFYNRQAQVVENKDWWSRSNEDIKKHIEAVKQVKEINDKIAKNRSELAMANAEASSRSFAFSGKEVQVFVEGLTKANTELRNMSTHYKQLEAKSNQAFRSDFLATLKLPTLDIDQMRIKLERLQELMRNGSTEQLISPDKVAKAKQEIESLAKAIEHHRKLLEESVTIDGSVSQGISQQASAEQQVTNATQQTVNAKKEELDTEKKITQEQEKRQEKKQTKGRTKQPLEDPAEHENVARAMAKTLDIDKAKKKSWDEGFRSLKNLNDELKQHRDAYSSMNAAGRNSPLGAQIKEEMRLLEQAIRRVKKEMERPTSFGSIQNMPTKTLDDMAHKMQKLQQYRNSIDLTKSDAALKLREVDIEMNKLQKTMDKYVTKSNTVFASNTALGRSWSYMKNRLAFYFSVGASTAFIRSLIDVRSQYELLERSIGILTNSMQQGTRVFAELNAMAMKSPFTTMELGAAAKQLTAYDVAAKDVVDTTRRLADMAAAVGIPIERLTYALGQIKAYGYLNARDARMFANAGIPLVKELAEHYTELEGRLVSTADVYDRIKKKSIEYNDVMAVMNGMTDAGGKFFNFQEKVAETLKVKIANLTLAWNNMLNEMGKDNGDMLGGMLSATKSVFEHWREIKNIIYAVLVNIGLCKAAQIVYWTWVGKTKLGLTTINSLQQASASILNKKVYGALASILKLIRKIFTVTGAVTASIAVLATMIGYAYFNMKDMAEANEQMNKSISDNAKENIESTNKFLEKYADSLKNVAGATKDEQTKMWERVQEQIELSVHNAEQYIERLEKIQDIGERVAAGQGVLEHSKMIQEEVKRIADVQGFSTDRKALGELVDMQEDVKDYRGVIKDINELTDEHIRGLKNNIQLFDKEWRSFKNVMYDAAAATTDALRLFGQLDDMNFNVVLNSDDAEENMASLRAAAEQLKKDFLATEKGAKITGEGLDRLNAAEDRWIAYRASEFGLLQKLSEAYKGYSEEQIENILENKSAWQRYFSYLTTEERRKVDAAIETNSLGSKTIQDIWEKAAKRMKESSLTAYLDIKDHIQELRNTPAIFIDIIYREKKEKLNDQQQAYYDRYIRPVAPQAKTYTEYNEREHKNLQKFGRFNIKNNEDNVEWEKRLGEQYQKNKKTIESLNGQLKNKARLSEADRAAKEKELKQLVAEQDTLKIIERDQNFNYAQFAQNSKKKAKQEDLILKVLKNEISVIKQLQSEFDKLSKKSGNSEDALVTIKNAFGKSIAQINAELSKYGLPQMGTNLILGKDKSKTLKHFQDSLSTLVKKGLLNLERSKALEAEISELIVSVGEVNFDNINKALDDKFSKIKDSYDLAIELDADPELGSMFQSVFKLDLGDAPKTAREYAKKIQDAINEQIKARGLGESPLTSILDLSEEDIKKQWGGDNDFSKLIIKGANLAREAVKKEIQDSQKVLEDYVGKYGDVTDRIMKIEEDKQRKMRQLNDLYNTEQLKATSEYVAKRNAIEKGAEREKSAARFEDFKASPLYVAMFENLDYASSKTLEMMKKKLDEVKENLNGLSPEQLKQIADKYNQIERALIKKNPFKNLVKNIKAGIKAMQEQQELQERLSGQQQIVDSQKKVVDHLNKQYEVMRQKGELNTEEGKALSAQLAEAKELLYTYQEILKALGIEVEKNQENKRLLSEQAQILGEKIGANLQSLGDFRDTIEKMFGDNDPTTSVLGDELNGLIDGLSSAGEGFSQAMQGFSSGNYVAGVTGVIKGLGGVGDAVASIFGDGAARTKRINREIGRSKETVRKLSLAYQNLERSVEKSLGTAETKARRLAIANKEEQLAETEKQLALEKSKRKKDRDNDAIKQYEETIQSLRNEIDDLKEDVVNNLLGSDVKAAAEQFVDTWVEAWKAGESTMDALKGSFDDMIATMLKKALASRLVAQRLQPIWDELDAATKAGSEGDEGLTDNELKKIDKLAESAVTGINEDLTTIYEHWRNMGLIGKNTADLSNLQQGIQSISEDTAGAIEAYLNGVSQQVYGHTELLTQIKDAILGIDINAQTGIQAQMLLQLQQSFQVHQSIKNMMEGALNASGSGFRVELIS